MATHLVRKINNLNLLLSRRLLCRHCSSSGGSHGDKSGDHGIKDTKDSNQGNEDEKVELTDPGTDDPMKLWRMDDRSGLPLRLEREAKELAQIRKMYEGTGVEVVKHEMDRGITRKVGVTGKAHVLIRVAHHYLCTDKCRYQQ